MPAHEFTARIEAGDSGGAYVTIPFDVERAFGAKRVPVVATFDGEPYRGSIVRMGGSCHILLIRKEIREKIGKQVGAEVRVSVERDTAPRIVAVPDDLRAALQEDPTAAAFFDQLSYTHQREYVQWIDEAKRAETRQRRVEKTVTMLQQRKKGR